MEDSNNQQNTGLPLDVASQSTSEPDSTAAAPETRSSGRRKFFTGIASAVGGALVVGGVTQEMSHKEASANAEKVRSRIISRIQDDLKKSEYDLMHGYDKPDGNGTHGRYVSGG